MNQNQLFNKSFLARRLAEYKAEVRDNAGVLLKWHNDNQKEEALQTNFLNDIFGKVLGYEIDTGEAEFNLLTEYKTQKDGTKVDGVLGFITKDKKDIRVAIELKAKNTTNLDSVEKQAFEYRDKIDGIEWVITSNTNEIRLYSAGSGGRLKYQSWTFLELANSLEKQREFHFLLSKDRLFTTEKSASLTHKLLEDNTKEEESIEKRFYNDYKDLRKKLFNHLREQNLTKEPTTLLSKTQKLLDRIIFVCFCEDLNLLPDKIFTKLLKTTQEAFAEITIWQQIKGLFSIIDTGLPKEKNINKFNGGLFAKDIELDELVLQDEILKEIIKISNWDFGSELTVNILGHIFEQSITDLEEIKAELENTSHDKKQGKRKKDGVFYTPEYITKYIVEEAVGGWLNDRKTELGIEKLPELTEEDFGLHKKYDFVLFELKEAPLEKLTEGLFDKNNRHGTLKDIATLPSPKNLKKTDIRSFDKINEHITFFRRYMLVLQNIKVLDPACGSGAFLVAVFNFLADEWQKVNSYLSKLGGSLFDVGWGYRQILQNNIYGVDLNPESVQITKLSLWLRTANKTKELTTLDSNIKCGNSLIDDASVETGFYINNEGKRVSLAFNWQNEFSHVFESGGFDVVVGNPPYVNVRNINLMLKEYYTSKYSVARGQYDLYTIFIEKGKNLLVCSGYLSFIIPDKFMMSEYGKPLIKMLYEETEIIGLKDYTSDNVFENVSVYPVVLVIKNHKTSKQTILLETSSPVLSKIENIDKVKDFKVWRPLASGGDIHDGSDIIISNSEVQRYVITTNKKGALKTFRSRDVQKNKILLKKLCYTFEASLDLDGYHPINTTYCLTTENTSLLYLLCLLNSKLFTYYAREKYKQTALRGGYIELRVNQIAELPFISIQPKAQTQFIAHAQKMLDLTRGLNEKNRNFLEYFAGKFGLQKITRNLGNWHVLEFADFIKELGKQKVSLSSTYEFDFKPLFDREKKACVDLQAQITKTDEEIEKMVYALYGLSEEEIRVVENIVV